jgi:hypothetical protein
LLVDEIIRCSTLSLTWVYVWRRVGKAVPLRLRKLAVVVVLQAARSS